MFTDRSLYDTKIGVKLKGIGLSVYWLLRDSTDLLRMCSQELLHAMSAGISYNALEAVSDIIKESELPSLSDAIRNFSYPVGQQRPPSLQDISFWDAQQKARFLLHLPTPLPFFLLFFPSHLFSLAIFYFSSCLCYQDVIIIFLCFNRVCQHMPFILDGWLHAGAIKRNRMKALRQVHGWSKEQVVENLIAVFVQLAELMRLQFAPEYDMQFGGLWLIEATEQFNEMYVKFFGRDEVVTCKLHMMRHGLFIGDDFGSWLNQSCAKAEAKHRQAKRVCFVFGASRMSELHFFFF